MENKKCCVMCGTDSGMLITMMGETKCSQCMKAQLIKENYDPHKEFSKAVRNLRKYEK